MGDTLAGGILVAVSLVAILHFVGFTLVSLWTTLRRRKLTIRELLLYIAGAGAAMALPACFSSRSEKHGDMVLMWWDVHWFSFFTTSLSLGCVVFLIHRLNKRES